MTTWFAQNSSVNIDSVNQWNDDPSGAGSWLTWASLDPGDILMWNGKTNISINVDVTCASIRNKAEFGASANGTGYIADGVTIVSDVHGPTVVGQFFLLVQGAASVNIIGNVIGQGVSGYAIKMESSGVLTIVGDISNAGTGAYAIWQAAGLIEITGNLLNTATGTNIFLVALSGGTLNVVGNVVGGAGPNASAIAVNATGSVVNITGDVTGGSLSEGIRLTSGTCRLTGNAYGGVWPAIGSAISPVTVKAIINGNTVAGVSGGVGVSTPYRLVHVSNELEETYRADDGGVAGDQRTLYTGGVNLGHPAEANVRDATTFGLSNEYTGSLKVPDPAYVSAGVLTDNTVGTLAAITASDLTTAMASYVSPPTGSPVERSPNDTNPITFSWPVSGATITAEVSINNAAYGATTGVVSFLRTEGSLHYYSLSYHADDRPTVEGTARYKLVDGTYTQYVTLRVDGISAELLANARIAAQNTQS